MLLSEAEVKLNSINKDFAPIPGRNKGGRGLWVEEQLGMKQSSQLNDFDDGELKAFKEGQTIAVTMVQHCLNEIFDRGVSYSQSNVGKQLKKLPSILSCFASSLKSFLIASALDFSFAAGANNSWVWDSHISITAK